MEESTPNLPTLRRSSKSKDENVEKITILMEDAQSKDLSKGQKAHEAIVEGFKEKIRSTFNELYGNYQHNKEAISHQIKNLQKNKTSHIQMSAKFEQTLRQKTHYDKLKLQVEIKNKKLQKLKQLLEREKGIKSQKQILQDELNKRLSQIKQNSLVIQNLDYQKGVLEQMRVDRRTLKETLKKRFNDMYLDYSEKSKRISKYYNENEIKRKLFADLSKQIPRDNIQIPENFAIQLQNKLETLYGKQAFQNIFYHESIINQEANRQEHQREMQEKEAKKKIKQQMEREEKRELDRVEGEYIKNKELEEKFLKQCGIRSLVQMLEDRSGENKQQIQLLKNELEEKIATINKENEDINKEINKVLSRNTDIQTTMRDLQKEYVKEHEEEKKLSHIAQKNNTILQSLQAIIDRITEEPGPIEDMNLKLAKFSSRLQRITEIRIKEKSKDIKLVKIPELQVDKNEIDNTILGDKEEEYLEEQFVSQKKQ